MTRQERDLDRLELRRPCPKRWDELAGSGARRFCSECQLQVTNLSDLARAEARAVLDAAEGRLCVSWRTDASGRVLFADRPRPAGPRSGWARAASLLFGLVPFLAACRDQAAPEEAAIPAADGAKATESGPAAEPGETGETIVLGEPNLDALMYLTGYIGD